MTDLINTQLGQYRLIELIGHGGMATVYRATDRRLGREVAVKLLHRHLRDSGEVARRFTAEARAVARLKHPNIVEIYDVSDDDAPERYLVAELVRGPSLRRLLTERRSLPAEITACLGSELAAALDRHPEIPDDEVLAAFQTILLDGQPPAWAEAPFHLLAVDASDPATD